MMPLEMFSVIITANMSYVFALGNTEDNKDQFSSETAF